MVRRLVLGLALVAATAHGGKARPAAGKARGARAAVAPGRAGIDRAMAERLGRGVRAYERGDFEAARRELLPVAGSRLAVRDLGLFFLAESEALAGAEAAAKSHFAALAALAGSRHQILAQARLGDLAFARKSYGEAKQAWAAVLAQPPPTVEVAPIRFRLGAIAEAAGQRSEAASIYRRVYVEHPLHPLAESARRRLAALAPAAAITAEERIQRARTMTSLRAWSQALDELALVPEDAPAAVRDEADYWIGTNHFRMRRGYDVAAAKLLAVAPRLSGDRKVEALFHGARAWSRADQDDRAIAGYRDLVERFPSSRFAAEAAFLVGWLDYNRGRYDLAIAGFEACLKRYGSSAFGDDALWYLGLSRWLKGDLAGALADFTRLGKRSGALDGGKGRYWQGRALDGLGRGEEAKPVYRELVTDYPFSYYAQLARLRLRQLGVTVGPFGDRSGSEGAVGARVDSATFERPDERLAAEPAIVRVDELLAAELPVLAGMELQAAEGSLLARLGGERALPLLLDRYRRAGNFHRLHRLGEAWSGGALRRDPHTVAAARPWWELVYPLAHQAFVERHGPSGDNPPYYLYTIMQKESAYNPHDVSYADAIGLLQMIPPTSRRVAARIGRPYSEDVLYDPEANIQFGSWYIGHLLQKFKGQIALGAGSYNAGPKAMMKWLKQHGSRPLDELIELVAYTQTREYMKKVLEIYARYVYLYGREDYLPSLTVDAAFVDNDLDY